jgi:hypothetical protein
MYQPASAVPALAAGELPLEKTTLYPEDDGFFGRRAKARRAKLLAGVEEALRRALAPGETIRYAARGVRYHLVEHLFGGAAVAQYHNMTALVLTDRRLLLLQLGRRGKIGDIKNEVPLDGIEGAKGAGILGWRVLLADGSKLAFGSVRSADRKRLQALLPARSGPRVSGPVVVHLCPSCLRPVSGKVGTTLTCPQQDCRIPFRDPRKAARLSAFLPGLGDLYLRHHLFGSLELLGSMAMLGVGLAFALQAAVDPDPGRVVSAVVVLALFVGLPRLIDHRLTLHMGRKGLVPLALAPAPGAQARNLPSYPRWSPLLFAAGVALAGAIVVALAQDLRHDAAVRDASQLAGQGRFDEARARFEALAQAGGVDEARRVRFALALLQAGDVEDADAVRQQFEGVKIESSLAERWNAAFAAEEAALADYNEGLKAILQDPAATWERVDRALVHFRQVKRPHLPRSRGEVHAHVAAVVLAEPLEEGGASGARRWVAGLGDAPPAEAAVIRAADASLRGDRTAARAALAGLPELDEAALPAAFRLLALEARARDAESDADRAAVRRAAEALLRADLDEDDAARVEAALERAR